MEQRNVSSPKSVKSQLSPEEVRQLDQAKDELFVQLYRKRRIYFERWRKVTLMYFAAIERGKKNAEMLQEDNIADVIERYNDRIARKQNAFKDRFPYETADDNETIRYLDGLDQLVKPENRSHRKALIRKEKEYHEKNQILNPNTRIPQEDAALQAEESSYDDDQAPLAADWKSEAGVSDTESYETIFLIPFGLQH